MTGLNQLGEELQQECEHKQANVHTVDIGIGGDNHAVIPQVVESILDVQRSLKQVEFLVLIHNLLLHAKRVERFASQREHGLRLHIANLGD